jgi:hypothetical protein
MDFIGPLPITDKGFDFIWTIIYRLTGMVYIIPITMSTGAAALADKYLHEIVRLHRVASSIVSDQDPRFTSKFWNEVQRLLSTKLLMSTTFHPETDSTTEWAN